MNDYRFSRKLLEQADWRLQDTKQTPFKPLIYFLDWQELRLCIKDFSHCNAVVKNTLGRWSTNREARVLHTLRGLQGIPSAIGIIEGPALVMTRVEASALPKPPHHGWDHGASTDTHLSPDFFSQAFRLLARLHERGVTHGDIHNTNLLLHSDGQPSLIDFASALVLDKRVSALKRWAWQTMARIDRISLLNLRQEHFPDHPLSSEEQLLLDTVPGVYRLHKRLRSSFIQPIKRFIRSR